MLDSNSVMMAKQNSSMPTVIFFILAILLTLIPLASFSDDITPGKHHQIVIAGFEFIPETLIVSSGDTVSWINKDIVPHSILSSQDQSIVSTVLAKGEQFTFVATESLKYACGLHPSMKGKILMSTSKHRKSEK